MLIFTVLMGFACLSVSIADVLMDMRYIKACNQTSPISLQTLNTVLIHQKLEGTNSNNFKCFLHCLYAKYGWMDEDGGFLVHQIKNVLDEAQVEISSLEYILFKCTALDSIDKCERSFMFTECFWKKVVQSDEKENDDRLFYHLDDK